MGRLLVHGARRAGWLEWKRARPIDVHVVGPVLEARSAEVYRELDVRAAAADERRPARLAVRVSDPAALILELTAAGWRVE
jgi:hypothetical protein